MAKDDGGHGSDASGGISHVEKHWDKMGISHSLSHNKGLVTLHKIVVPKDKRGEGVGSQAMAALTDHADKNGLRVALTPSSDFGGNKGRLVEFYKRHGFKENKGRSRDFSTRETMIREPSGAKSAHDVERAKVRDT